jgi:tRNA/tmRNA/rRNA uracil-C5-methylase (TrmA/RlmC/RlmD family)
MVREIEVSENVDASERVIHLDNHSSGEATLAQGVFQAGSVTGLSATSSIPGVARVLFGSPYVADALEIEGTRIDVRRHVSSFFQGNRFLLRDLVAHVSDQVPQGSQVIDLYAGGGLFALKLATGATVGGLVALGGTWGIVPFAIWQEGSTQKALMWKWRSGTS